VNDSLYKGLTAHEINRLHLETDRRRSLENSNQYLYKNDLDKKKVDVPNNPLLPMDSRYSKYIDASNKVYDSSTDDDASGTGITKQIVNIILLSITVLFIVILLFSAILYGFVVDFIVSILLIVLLVFITVIKDKEYQRNYVARLLVHWKIQIGDYDWIYLLCSVGAFILIQLYFYFSQESKSISSHIAYLFFLFFTIFMVFLFACRWIFSYDLLTIIFDTLYTAWFELSNKEININDMNSTVDTDEQKKEKEEENQKQKDKLKKDSDVSGDAEVFNISNNIYTYEDAQSVCKLYNGRLATYQEVEKSYENGGEFCNYGWSDSQMILFPTQQKTWDALQKTKSHNMCGRPGINGGYMSDKNAKFGVNCYAVKPKAKPMDKEKNIVQLPQDEETLKKIKYWKDNSDTLLKVNAFNYSRWNE
jgi:ABC-type multidrug transport system fused ATPase/permease subunit